MEQTKYLLKERDDGNFVNKDGHVYAKYIDCGEGHFRRVDVPPPRFASDDIPPFFQIKASDVLIVDDLENPTNLPKIPRPKFHRGDAVDLIVPEVADSPLEYYFAGVIANTEWRSIPRFGSQVKHGNYYYTLEGYPHSMYSEDCFPTFR